MSIPSVACAKIPVEDKASTNRKKAGPMVESFLHWARLFIVERSKIPPYFTIFTALLPSAGLRRYTPWAACCMACAALSYTPCMTPLAL